MHLRHVLLALFLALSGAAYANDYPTLASQVDAALAESPQLDEDVRQEIMALREEGEAQHAQGDDESAVESLSQALLLLGKL